MGQGPHRAAFAVTGFSAVRLGAQRNPYPSRSCRNGTVLSHARAADSAS